MKTKRGRFHRMVHFLVRFLKDDDFRICYQKHHFKYKEGIAAEGSLYFDNGISFELIGDLWIEIKEI